MRLPSVRYAVLPMLAVLTLYGCAPTPETIAASEAQAAEDARKLALALEGLVPGPPVSCIDQQQIRSVRSIGNDVLIYRMKGNLIYRNDPHGGCTDLRRGALITRTPSARICAGDIGQVRDLTSGTDYGSCIFGEFTPYRPG